MTDIGITPRSESGNPFYWAHAVYLAIKCERWFDGIDCANCGAVGLVDGEVHGWLPCHVCNRNNWRKL